MSFDRSSSSPRNPANVSHGPDCPQCPCCRARAAALETTWWDPAPEWNSPLTPGVLSENLTCTAEDRSMRVELWREWQRMFAGLQHLGPLRAMTMNRCVALEQWRPWPELQWSEEGDRAIDEDGDFDFDFRFWARAFARHRRSSTGHVFSVEFFDSEEVCFHRLCLTPQSSLETFTEWARTHQRCPGPETSAKVEPADRDPLGEGEWRSADVDSVRRMLVECEAHRLSVRAIAGTSAAVQSARFVPLHASSADGWICSIGENAALHFHPASFAHVRLHDLAPGGVECWTLRAYDESGCLVLMLMPAALSHLQLWNELVRDLD